MLVYIKPHSTFPELHSDTIFGALTYAINELFPDILEEMIDKFEKGNPPFILTSAFPYIKSEDIIRFYPKPILGNDLSEFDIDSLKKYKNIKYLDEEIFLDFINGKITEFDLIRDMGDYNRISSFLLSKKKVENVVYFGKNIITNNSVNRISNETDVFYSEGNSYRNSGLYFLIKFFDDTYKDIIKSSIKFLKDRGFGKDISTGKGHFDYILEENDNLPLNNEGNYFVSLSRYIPQDTELDAINENSFYEISSKRGRHPSGDLKKQIRFFKEGSTFADFQLTYGIIVQVGVNVKSIEYGYAFPIRFKGEFKNEM